MPSLVSPPSLEEAAGRIGDGARPLAGGTDLVPLVRDELVAAETLVHVGPLLPRGVEAIESAPPNPERGHHRIGAGTTLAELEASGEIPAALREACRLAASPQLRSMGTLGGNLRQATRCWYWRLAFPCYLHGGDRCHAREGEHREHAIFGNDRCASAHPSDPAAALLALGARVVTNRRELPIEELYRLPSDDDRDVVALEDGELILHVDVPRPDVSTYLKAMDRKRFSFPLVGVAAARTPERTRIALSGAAPVPWLLATPEALDTATPLPGTAYKLDIARALVERALEALS